MSYLRKTIIFPVLLVWAGCGILDFGEGGWELVREPEADFYYYSIHFVDHRHGWTVGDSGRVIYSRDGGRSWKDRSLETSQDLKAVHFINRQTGWTGGHQRALYKTTDGGQSWHEIELPIDNEKIIFEIHFVNEETGWVVHNGGELLYTEDGGDTWEVQTSWERGGAGRLSFVSGLVGYVLPAIDGGMLKTTDGGRDWNPIPRPDTRWETDMCFVDEQRGWIINTKGPSSYWDDYANVFCTADGGQHWTCQDTLPEKHLSAIHFVDESVGWLAAGSNIYQTTDSGRNWTCEFFSEEIFLGLRDIFFIDAEHGWALDFHGGICRYRAP